jgi:hypothetical protein
VREVKHITRGVPDLGSAADPSSLTLTLDNRSGKYSMRNAMSPLYGLIGRNTPIRVSVPSDEDHYLQLDGRTGNYVSTADTASLDITGDLDVRAELAPDWYGSNNQLVLGKWNRSTLQQSWVLQVGDGAVYFRFTTDGDEYKTGRYFGRTLPELPERAAIRATLDIDNGNGGNTVTFYWAESLSAPNGWTQIGEPVTVAAGTDPIFSGSASLTLGTTDLRNGIARPRYPLNGRGYRYEVRNGINGTVVASPDFRAATPGASTIVDSQGLTWTLSGASEIRDRDDRFVGEVASWPLRWSTDDTDRYSPITANGILRRLGQGAKSLDSTLRRRIPTGNPVAYWPMEEQEEAVQAYSPIPGVLPASVSSVEWASWDTLPSSAPLPRLTGISSLSAPVPDFTPGQWQVEFVYNADDIVPVGEDVELVKILSTNGTIRKWVILLRSGRATVQGFSSTNVKLIEQFIGVGADVFHGWTRLRFYAIDVEGGTGFDWRINWQDVGGDAGGLGRTYPTGTCGSVSMVSADWPALTEGWGVGHLAVLREANSALYTGSDDAYRGEDVVARLRRLGQEEKLSITRTPGALPPAKVGYQRQVPLVDLFEAAAEGDGGLLTEDMRRIGLQYRDRSSLYSQTPLISLSYNEPGLGPDLEPVDDDSAVINDITVTRDGGSSARAVLETGPLSVNAAPDGIGKYDSAATLSLAEDDQTDPVAYWKLHLGTYDAARYPTVSLMLHKPGAEWLIPLVLKLREGDKIRITDLPEWVSHDEVDLIVLGWQETLDLYRWELTLNCVPADPWDTAVTDHPLYGQADTDGTILATAATSTATDLTIRTTAGPMWTSDPQFLPYYIRASGELMRVKSVGSMPIPDNPYMDGGISGWGVDTNATVGYSTTVKHPKAETGSLVITPNGTGAVGGAASTLSAPGTLKPLTRYRVGYWAYSPTGMADLRATVHQYNAAGTFLATAGPATGTVLPANVWTWIQYDFTSAANTDRGRVRPRFDGTPPAQPFYVWGARCFAVSDLAVSDTFTRSTTNGWGNADSGQPWQVYGNAPVSDYVTNGSIGRHIHSTKNVFRITALNTISLKDVETLTTFTMPVVPTGEGIYTYFPIRTNSDVTQYYFTRVFFSSSAATAELSLRKRTPSETVLATYGTKLTHSAGAQYTVRQRVEGDTLYTKFWKVGTAEPEGWQLTVTDTSLPNAGGIAVRSFLGPANTNTLPVNIEFDDISVTDSQIFTVDRSVNGVVKAQTYGTAINIATPAITSL